MRPFAVLAAGRAGGAVRRCGGLAQMTDRFGVDGQAQIMVEPVPYERVSQYGVVDLNGADLHQGKHALMSQVVEKPARAEAPIKSGYRWPLCFAGEYF